jgi:hypothetical protein
MSWYNKLVHLPIIKQGRVLYFNGATLVLSIATLFKATFTIVKCLIVHSPKGIFTMDINYID